MERCNIQYSMEDWEKRIPRGVVFMHCAMRKGKVVTMWAVAHGQRVTYNAQGECVRPKRLPMYDVKFNQ